MAYTEGTGLTYFQLLQAIKTFVTANGWTLMREQTVDTIHTEIILESSEYKGKKCYVGLRTANKSTSFKHYCTGFWTEVPSILINMYTGYTGGVFNGNTNPAMSGTTNYAGLACGEDDYLWDYYIHTDGKCIILSAVPAGYTGSVGAFGNYYMGFFTSYLPVGDYEYPICYYASAQANVTQSFPNYKPSTGLPLSIVNTVKVFTAANTWATGQTLPIRYVSNNEWAVNTENITPINSGGVGGFQTLDTESKTIMTKLYLVKRDTTTAGNNMIAGEFRNCLGFWDSRIAPNDTITVGGQVYHVPWKRPSGYTYDLALAIKRS